MGIAQVWNCDWCGARKEFAQKKAHASDTIENRGPDAWRLHREYRGEVGGSSESVEEMICGACWVFRLESLDKAKKDRVLMLQAEARGVDMVGVTEPGVYPRAASPDRPVSPMGRDILARHRAEISRLPPEIQEMLNPIASSMIQPSPVQRRDLLAEHKAHLLHLLAVVSEAARRMPSNGLRNAGIVQAIEGLRGTFQLIMVKFSAGPRRDLAENALAALGRIERFFDSSEYVSAIRALQKDNGQTDLSDALNFNLDLIKKAIEEG